MEKSLENKLIQEMKGFGFEHVGFISSDETADVMVRLNLPADMHIKPGDFYYFKNGEVHLLIDEKSIINSKSSEYLFKEIKIKYMSITSHIIIDDCKLDSLSIIASDHFDLYLLNSNVSYATFNIKSDEIYNNQYENKCFIFDSEIDTELFIHCIDYLEFRYSTIKARSFNIEPELKVYYVDITKEFGSNRPDIKYFFSATKLISDRSIFQYVKPNGLCQGITQFNLTMENTNNGNYVEVIFIDDEFPRADDEIGIKLLKKYYKYLTRSYTECNFNPKLIYRSPKTTNHDAFVVIKFLSSISTKKVLMHLEMLYCNASIIEYIMYNLKYKKDLMETLYILLNLMLPNDPSLAKILTFCKKIYSPSVPSADKYPIVNIYSKEILNFLSFLELNRKELGLDQDDEYFIMSKKKILLEEFKSLLYSKNIRGKVGGVCEYKFVENKNKFRSIKRSRK